MAVYERNDDQTFIQSIPGQSQQAAGSGQSLKAFLRDADNGNTLDLAVANGTLMAPRRYKYVVPTNAFFLWSRAGISLRDGGLAIPQRFGSGPALTNGCKVQLLDPMGTQVDEFATDELPIVDNGTLDVLAGNIVEYRNGDEGEDGSVVSSQWFLELEGQAIRVSPSYQIVFQVRDNITGLDSPSVFWVSGRLVLIP